MEARAPTSSGVCVPHQPEIQLFAPRIGALFDAARAPSRRPLRSEHGHKERLVSPHATASQTTASNLQELLQSSAAKLGNASLGSTDILHHACALFDLAGPEELQDFLACLVLSECVYKKLEMDEDGLARTMSSFASQFPPGWLQLEEVQLSLNDTPQHYLVATGGNSMYVAFMGTKQARDLVTDAAVLHEPVWAEAVALAEDKKAIPAAHSGFLSRARSIQVEHLYELARASGRKLVLCGHSLGGAVAKLCALRLLRELPEWPTPPALRCYCFATPAVGNAALAELVASAGWASFFKTYYLPEDQLIRLVALAQSQRRSNPLVATAATAAATVAAGAADSRFVPTASSPPPTDAAALPAGAPSRTASAPIPIDLAVAPPWGGPSRGSARSTESLQGLASVGGASPTTPSPVSSPSGPLSPIASLTATLGLLAERWRGAAAPAAAKGAAAVSTVVPVTPGVLPATGAGATGPLAGVGLGGQQGHDNEKEDDVESLSDEEAAAVEEILAPPSSLGTSPPHTPSTLKASPAAPGPAAAAAAASGTVTLPGSSPFASAVEQAAAAAVAQGRGAGVEEPSSTAAPAASSSTAAAAPSPGNSAAAQVKPSKPLPTNVGLALALQRKRVARHLRNLARHAHLPLPLLEMPFSAPAYHAFGAQRFIIGTGVVPVAQDGTPAAPAAPRFSTFRSASTPHPTAGAYAPAVSAMISSSSSRSPAAGPLSWLPWRSPPPAAGSPSTSEATPAAADTTAAALPPTSGGASGSTPVGLSSSQASVASIDVSLEPPRGMFSHHRMLAYRCRVLHVIRDLQDALLHTHPELFEGLPVPSSSTAGLVSVQFNKQLVPRMQISHAVARPPLHLGLPLAASASKAAAAAATAAVTCSDAVPAPAPKPASAKDSVSLTVHISGSQLRFCRSVSCRLVGWQPGSSGSSNPSMGVQAELLQVEEPVGSSGPTWVAGLECQAHGRMGRHAGSADGEQDSSSVAPGPLGPLQRLSGVVSYLWAHAHLPMGGQAAAAGQAGEDAGGRAVVRLTMPRAAMEALTASSSWAASQQLHGRSAQSDTPAAPVRLELTLRSDFHEAVTAVVVQPFRVGVFGLSQRASGLLHSALAASPSALHPPAAAADGSAGAASRARNLKAMWLQWPALVRWRAGRGMAHSTSAPAPAMPGVGTLMPAASSSLQRAASTLNPDASAEAAHSSVRVAAWVLPVLQGGRAFAPAWLTGPVRLLARATGPWVPRVPRPLPPADTAAAAVSALPLTLRKSGSGTALEQSAAQPAVQSALGQQLRAAAVAAAAASAAVTSASHVPALADVGGHSPQAAAVAAALAAAAARAAAVPAVMAAAPSALGLTSSPAPSPYASDDDLPASAAAAPTSSSATLPARSRSFGNILSVPDAAGRPLRLPTRSSAGQQSLESVVQPLSIPQPDMAGGTTAASALLPAVPLLPGRVSAQPTVSGRPRWRLWRPTAPVSDPDTERAGAGCNATGPNSQVATSDPSATTVTGSDSRVTAATSPETPRWGWRLARAVSAMRRAPPGPTVGSMVAPAQPNQLQAAAAAASAVAQHTTLLGAGALLVTDLNAAAPRARAHPLALLRTLAASLWQQGVEQQPLWWRWWVRSGAAQLAPRAAVARFLRTHWRGMQPAAEQPQCSLSSPVGAGTTEATAPAAAALSPLDVLLITANAEEPRFLNVLNSRAFAAVRARAAQARVLLRPVLLTSPDTQASKTAAAAEALARACGVHVAEVQTVVVGDRQLLVRPEHEIAAARWLAALGGRALPYLPLWAQNAAAATPGASSYKSAGAGTRALDGEGVAHGWGSVQGAGQVVEQLVRVLEGQQNTATGSSRGMRAASREQVKRAASATGALAGYLRLPTRSRL